MQKNATESPSVPAYGHLSGELGCDDFKGQAQEIAYGQAGKGGCKADKGKVKGQMKHYGWSE